MKNDKEVTYYENASLSGHDAFLLENKEMEDIVRNFLRKVR